MVKILTRQSRIKVLKTLIVWAYFKKKKDKRNLLKNKIEQIHHRKLVPEISIHEPWTFFNYHRMDVKLFDELLQLVKPKIEKSKLTRTPIPTGLRLSLTLSYLASGNLMRSLCHGYQISEASAGNIISETCEAIWDVLFRFQLHTAEKWKSIAKRFDEKLNFPNCLGAIDARHCIIQTSAESSSSCSNTSNNGLDSIILMAACDADCNFLVVDIEPSRKFSYCDDFKKSDFIKALCYGNKLLNLPDDTFLPRTDIQVPYVFVGDNTFPLMRNLMRPFVAMNNAFITTEESIFNYRLSRARSVVDNAFGVLTARWKIFQSPIQAERKNVVKIIKATICLHNWLKEKFPTYCPSDYVDSETTYGEIVQGRWRSEIQEQTIAMQTINIPLTNHSEKDNRDIRNNFKYYFSNIDVTYEQPSALCDLME